MDTDNSHLDQATELLEAGLTERILGACMSVSNALGIGFLESVYQKALLIALRDAGLGAQAEVPLSVKFKGHCVGEFFADVLVEDRVVLELKACAGLTTEHQAQLMNYLRASGIRVGLVVNFGKPRLEWKRIVC